ncbi:hypothetical protein [Cryptosporangium arvum]|nr:hypothetical protein [Cryptosporangium arvum]
MTTTRTRALGPLEVLATVRVGYPERPGRRSPRRPAAAVSRP